MMKKAKAGEWQSLSRFRYIRLIPAYFMPFS